MIIVQHFITLYVGNNMRIKINLTKRDGMTISKYITADDQRETFSGFYGQVVPVDDYEFERFKKYIIQLLPIEVNELAESPHITVCYSKEKVENPPKKFLISDRPQVTHVEYWEGHDKLGYVVAKLESPTLTRINSKLVAAGGTAANFPDYSPHITIAKEVGECGLGLDRKLEAVNLHLAQNKYTFEIGSIQFQDLKAEAE